MARSTQKKQHPAKDERFGDSFSFGDMVKWTGATRSNLIHWTNIGIIKPDIEDTAGPGYPRRFSTLNFAEVQMAAILNRFRLPAAFIGDAVAAFRFHHELCVAISAATPSPTDTTQDSLTDEQRRAVEDAYARAPLRGRRKLTKKQSARAAQSVQDLVFTDDHQRLMLYHARTWDEFRRSGAFRTQHFYGLFVSPDDGVIEIADEPFDLQKAIADISIVINLGSVVEYTQAVSGYRL